MEIIVAPITRANATRNTATWRRGNFDCLGAQALREETGEEWYWGVSDGFRVRDGKQFGTNADGERAINEAMMGQDPTVRTFVVAEIVGATPANIDWVRRLMASQSIREAAIETRNTTEERRAAPADVASVVDDF